jgi:nitroimidazol reductase NimA-like FMN-containing flavoprotein (pyridoxamine 5'-phosphate oxidase superfamily)
MRNVLEQSPEGEQGAGSKRESPGPRKQGAFRTTKRTRIRRKPARGSYERAEVFQILDRALICHVAFVIDGQPYAMPTIHARRGETLYLHGSNGSRMLRVAAAGEALCVTVSIVDGIVLARSGFHHSLNYRSAVVLGVGRPVSDADEKRLALEAVVEHIMPGRTADARGPSAKELRATTVVAIPLEEASAKARTGPPVDDDEDLSLPIWAGVLPLALEPGEPIRAPELPEDVPLPGYVTRWRG